MLRWMLGVLVLMVCLPVRAATGGEQEVVLAVAGGVLHGTLSMPDGQGKVPVVLLHAGSGPTDRNGNSAMLPGQNNALRMLAEALARNGIATLRYDKRGIGASASAGRREADLRLDDYIDDATAWLRQLRADPRFTNVLMAGHSEGALIAMVACQKAQLDGCVLIAGAGNALDDILRVQLKPRLPPDLYAQNERILLALERAFDLGLHLFADGPGIRIECPCELDHRIARGGNGRGAAVPQRLAEAAHDVAAAIDLQVFQARALDGVGGDL